MAAPVRVIGCSIQPAVGIVSQDVHILIWDMQRPGAEKGVMTSPTWERVPTGCEKKRSASAQRAARICRVRSSSLSRSDGSRLAAEPISEESAARILRDFHNSNDPRSSRVPDNHEA